MAIKGIVKVPHKEYGQRGAVLIPFLEKKLENGYRAVTLSVWCLLQLYQNSLLFGSSNSFIV
jgi:hypothetical protein